MYKDIINNEISIPLDIEKDNLVIKKEEIQEATSIEEKIKVLKEESMKMLEQKKISIEMDMTLEKQRILESITNKSNSFFEQQDAILGDMSSSLNTIIIQILEKLKVDISYSEKLKFSLDQILKDYRHKENLSLIVRSTESFNNLGIQLPEGWSLKEDPNISGDCKLELAGGAVECSFDNFFEKLVSNISDIKSC